MDKSSNKGIGELPHYDLRFELVGETGMEMVVYERTNNELRILGRAVVTQSPRLGRKGLENALDAVLDRSKGLLGQEFYFDVTEFTTARESLHYHGENCVYPRKAK
jgi:hypothetical protein